jgi:hypothetical protein
VASAAALQMPHMHRRRQRRRVLFAVGRSRRACAWPGGGMCSRFGVRKQQRLRLVLLLVCLSKKKPVGMLCAWHAYRRGRSSCFDCVCRDSLEGRECVMYVPV